MPRTLGLLFLSCIACEFAGAQTSNEAPERGFEYVIRPAFSFLMSTVHKPDDEALALSMYGQLRTQCTFDIGGVHFKSYVNLDYIRQAYSDRYPETMRDDFVVTMIPSVILSKETNISLFLELTMETRLTNRTLNGDTTSFMDPAFFYETLYVGQWKEWKSDDGLQKFSMRYGVGYAFQQTVANRFLLTGERAINLDPENPLSAIRQAPNVTLESGYSLLAAADYNGTLSENLTAFLQAFAVSLSKKVIGGSFKQSHVVTQFGAGLTYNVFSLRYDFRMLYDPNYSFRRQLDQTATFGIQLEFKN
jgi:hypothetical protein